MNNLERPGSSLPGQQETEPVLLSCQNLSFRYAQEWVLQDISLDLHESQTISILGPSGCGKSTLLKLAGSFLQPIQGEVLFEGKKMVTPDPSRVMVFQHPDQLFPWKTVLKNVLLSLTHLEKQDAINRAKKALTEVGMEKDLQKYPAQLSGGMAQRTALARSFAGEPKVLLMDEPFGSVDAIQRKELQKLLLGLIEKHKTATLFVTHDIEEAMTLGDRVMILNSQGRCSGVFDTTDLDLPGLEVHLEQAKLF